MIIDILASVTGKYNQSDHLYPEDTPCDINCFSQEPLHVTDLKSQDVTETTIFTRRGIVA